MKAPLTDGSRAHTRLDPARERRDENGNAVFHGDALAAARAKLCAHLGQHRPEQPYTGGVRLVVKWLFPRGKHQDGSYRTTKPDTDNLQKLLKDCMTAEHFWTDDALVCSEITEKFWADTPGIWIHIEPVEG